MNVIKKILLKKELEKCLSIRDKLKVELCELPPGEHYLKPTLSRQYEANSKRIVEIHKLLNPHETRFDEIEDVISDIMIYDGPDGHCDGSSIITKYVCSLLDGTDKDWKENYYISKKN